MNSYKNITCVTAPIIFTSDDIYAAQCLWEAHLEKEVINKKLEQYHDEYGTVHMREELGSKDILDALYEGFQIAQFAGFDDCFDWQYVPFFYSYCLTSSKFDDRICLAPNWRQFCMLKGEIVPPQTVAISTEEQYLKSPSLCPNCGSNDLSGDSFIPDIKTVCQTVTCESCDFSWDDIYTLTNVDFT